MQIKLTDRARELGAPHVVEALARSEIERALGPSFKLPSVPAPTTEIRVYIPHAHLVAVPVGPSLWVVDTLDMRRLGALSESIIVAPRAAALIANLGWNIADVEAEARRVLAEGDMSARCVLFQMPLEMVRFAVWNEDGRREIDLDEFATEVRS
jgi:hypothetical protein